MIGVKWGVSKVVRQWLINLCTSQRWCTKLTLLFKFKLKFTPLSLFSIEQKISEGGGSYLCEGGCILPKINFHGPFRNYIVKENHIGSAVRKIQRYKLTDILLLLHLLSTFLIPCWLKCNPLRLNLNYNITFTDL